MIAPARKLLAGCIERERIEIALARRFKLNGVAAIGEAGGRFQSGCVHSERRRRRDVARRRRGWRGCTDARTAAAGRHRPITERFETLARDVEDALAIAAL